MKHAHPITANDKETKDTVIPVIWAAHRLV